MREIGCCTWIFGDTSLEDVAMRASRAGMDGVEVAGDIETIDPVRAKGIFADAGLKVFSITPADADISHPDTRIRQAALAYYDQLMDFAVALGSPRIACHGQVARIKPITSQEEEDALLIDAVRQVCRFAASRGIEVVFEILNRYETHQVRTIAEGQALLGAVNAPNLKLLPDAYHMNIEEADPATALRQGGADIGLYHAADSNRCGLGEGHIAFEPQMRALDAIGYTGPIIVETNAPGPNPFTPNKGEGVSTIVEAQLARSLAVLRALGT